MGIADPYGAGFAAIGEFFLATFAESIDRYQLTEHGKGQRSSVALKPSTVAMPPWVAAGWKELESRAKPSNDFRFHCIPMARAYRCHSARNARRRIELSKDLPLCYTQMGFVLIGMPELLEHGEQPWICTVGDTGKDSSDQPACPLFNRIDNATCLCLRREDYLCIHTDYAVVHPL